MASKITLAEAVKKVDELTESARQQTYPQANFTNPDKDYDFPCSNPDGSPSKTLRNATVSYQLSGIPKERLNDYKESLKQWWQRSGFTVDNDGSKPDFIRAVDKAGYSMALQVNDLGQAYLMTTSPCSQKSGAADS